ncbi:MAG: maleylpyruvate isomerase family mycothiol-dependent enzyme [Acidimicrobiia bacterium]|nr:maleylpyruvate isomerase family mycothiol-dependent enzyme [Acidimicrobiia bacterium]
MTAPLDFIDHIRRESARFAEVLTSVEPDAIVPTCPDWSASDLLWHLTEVQLFWSIVVRDRLGSPDAAEAAIGPRPDGFDATFSAFDDATRELVDVLTSTPRETEVWTWADDHSVGFLRRRQAQEALIHRLDAEQTAGAEHAIDPALAADGVDEVLRIVIGGVPAWADFIADGHTARVHTTDEPMSWDLRFGRFTGVSPNTGISYDDEAFVVDDDVAPGTPGVVLRGPAGRLDAWLWGRGAATDLSVDGDSAVFDRLAAIVAEGVE